MKKANALEDAHIPVEDKKDMIYVEMLATHPESQGKGYASALLDTITFEVCRRSRLTNKHKLNCFRDRLICAG